MGRRFRTGRRTVVLHARRGAAHARRRSAHSHAYAGGSGHAHRRRRATHPRGRPLKPRGRPVRLRLPCKARAARVPLSDCCSQSSCGFTGGLPSVQQQRHQQASYACLPAPSPRVSHDPSGLNHVQKEARPCCTCAPSRPGCAVMPSRYDIGGGEGIPGSGRPMGGRTPPGVPPYIPDGGPSPVCSVRSQQGINNCPHCGEHTPIPQQPSCRERHISTQNIPSMIYPI